MVATVTDANLITGNLLIKANEPDAIPQKVHRSDVKLLSKNRKPKEEKLEEPKSNITNINLNGVANATPF